MGSSATEVDQLLRAARRHLAQGEFHEAAERAAEAIRLNGKAVAAYLLRAEAHRRLRRPERALADLAVAIRLDPQQPGPYVVRAEILKRRNVFDQAIADATYALALDPRNAAAFSIRAQCRHAIGDREGAAEDVQEMLLIDLTRPVPDLGAGPTTASPIDSGDEPSRKRAGRPASASTSDLFADGKPVDKTYRSRPAVVSDKEAPEELGAASGYRPEVMSRPLPRTRPARRPARGTSPLAVLLVGGLCVLGGGYLMSRLGGGQQQPAEVADGRGTPSSAPDAGSRPPISEAAGRIAGPAIPIAEAGLAAGGPEQSYLVTLPRIDLHEQNGWWSDRGELVLGGLSGNPVARKPLMFDGQHSGHGIYLHARPSGEVSITYRLGGRFGSFRSEVLIPEMFPQQADPKTPLVFKLVGDERTIWQSRPLGLKGDHQPCSVDVTGIDELSLRVECRGPENWGLAAWVEPRLTAAPGGDEPARPDLRERMAATPEGEGGEPLASGLQVDLLVLADPRTAISGEWTRTGTALAVRADGDRPAVLPIPHAPLGEYDLEVRAEGGGLLMIGLPQRGALLAACLDLAYGKYWLQQIEGQPLQDNESTRRGPANRSEDGLTFRCSVRDGGVEVSCDRRRLIDWEGDYSRFSARPLALAEIPDRRSPFLASWVDRRITALRLTTIDGEGVMAYRQPGGAPEAGGDPIRSSEGDLQPVRLRIAISEEGECRVLVGRSLADEPVRPGDGMAPITTSYASSFVAGESTASEPTGSSRFEPTVPEFAKSSSMLLYPRALRLPCLLTMDIAELRDGSVGVQFLTPTTNVVIYVESDDALRETVKLRAVATGKDRTGGGSPPGDAQKRVNVEQSVSVSDPEELRFRLPVSPAQLDDLYTLDAVLRARPGQMNPNPTVAVRNASLLGREDRTLGMELGVGQGKAVVERVEPGGLAEAAGLRVGDTVVAVDGNTIPPLKDAGALTFLIELGIKPTAVLTVLRGGREKEITIDFE